MGKFICIFEGEEREVRTRVEFPVVLGRQKPAMLSYRTIGIFLNNNKTRECLIAFSGFYLSCYNIVEFLERYRLLIFVGILLYGFFVILLNHPCILILIKQQVY